MSLTDTFPCTVRLARRGIGFTLLAGFIPLVAFMLSGDPDTLRLAGWSVLFMAAVATLCCLALGLMEWDDARLDRRRADAQRRAKQALWQAQLRRVR